MCSIGEDDFGDEGGVHSMIPDTPIQVINDNQRECTKCGKLDKSYKLPYREAECKNCFLLYARHKFRAALGSSKILPKNSKVVLAFNGRAESMVLLDMLHHAQTENNYKRLHCLVEIVYIDTFAVDNIIENSDSYKRHLLLILNFLKKYPMFKYYIMPMSYKSRPITFSNMEDYVSRERTDELVFQHDLNSIKSLSSRQDFLKHHKIGLITRAANTLGCKFAFLANVSTSLATNFLSAVVLGRGASASLDVSLVDHRLGKDVKLVRPIKDLTHDEIQLYMCAQNLKVLNENLYGNTFGATGSLQNLTKTFVQNLQQNFPSTVSTIFRTGDKIAPAVHINDKMSNLSVDDSRIVSPSSCTFCDSVNDNIDSKTLLALEFSRLVSQSADIINNYDALDERARTSVNGDIENDLPQLCHACRNIVNDSDNAKIIC